MADVLTLRQLNRATLARQLLLERVAMPGLDAVEHLVGLQAQEPRDPYVGLWSRLQDFRPAELETLLLDRKVVRLVVQRGTVHAVTAGDCLVLRPLAQPILTQQLHSHRDHAPRLDGVDLDTVMSVAAGILAESPRNTRQLRSALAEHFPQHDAAAMAFACRNLLPFVQVPPRGLWSRSGEVVGTTAAAWLGRDVEANPSVDDVMLRYVAAYGPATVRDAAAWSRYTRLRDVFDRLRPRLRTFRDERGRELFDLPDAPRPDDETPAPVRFLPTYDNVLLSHADRTRFIDEDDRRRMSAGDRRVTGGILVDGRVAGGWRFDGETTLEVVTFTPLTPSAVADVDDEGRRFAQFLEPSARPAIELQPW